MKCDYRLYCWHQLHESDGTMLSLPLNIRFMLEILGLVKDVVIICKIIGIFLEGIHVCMCVCNVLESTINVLRSITILN